MPQVSRRIERTAAGLLIVDVQERLLPAVCDQEPLVQNVLRLVKGATVMQLPIFVTEQYRKGLGPTVAEIASAVPDFAPIEKLSFSACGAPGLPATLQSRAVREIVLCGLETHVCVAQTCLDLLDAGLRVFVVTDAVSSRTPANRQAGLDRMRDAGAVMVSTEMILFELLERAGSEEFKRVQSLVR